ncbi:rhamnulokinase family protein [Prevotella sp. 10(H)]|uniref:rhamnulokinase n=1 Tax=Prevotella sp. 10(H) TaxID=1158294 RepID=UPI0004A70CA5|nr:rhamnulokinase family protein [Prevotella sp. 10(H)]
MSNTYNFLAFDIGATSGRSIIGTLCDGKLELNELTRFPNKIIHIHDKYYWDVFALYEALKDGLKAASSQGIKVDAIGIDTWGVDFVYLGEDGSILGTARCYRDPYTVGMPEEYFKIIPRKEVYELTGIQIMNFNSLFQLFAAKKEDSSALAAAKEILFMPDALSYLLTNKKVCEYTIASTAQLLNPATKKIEKKLLETIGINASIVPPVIMPGQKIGNLHEALAKECGLADIPLIAVAGHDTGSAVVSVPAQNKNFAYLSSGTWSLMGIEVDDPIVTEESYEMNFTNEGGVDGTVRFLKNITGMWLLEQCRKEWELKGKKCSYPEIVAMSDSAKAFQSLVDPDDASFANPESMTEAIAAFCERTNQKIPQTDAEFIRCIFDSLAMKYRYVLSRLQKVAPFPIEKLHVIGGGSQNNLLNQMTANAIGIPVVAGPCEATAIGNIMMQAKGLGLVESLQDIRNIVNNSVNPDVFLPKDTELWDETYKHFLTLLNI